MRGFVALLRKEARDIRTQAIVAAVVALALSIAANWLFFRNSEGALAAQIVVPVLVGCFVASTASDLVAGDVATRRIESLAMLPIPLSRVWTAKAALLAVASAMFLLWVVGCQFAILRFAGNETAAATFIDALPATAPTLAAVFSLGGAALFFSTLLERGFASVFGAVAVLVALGFALETSGVPYVSASTTFAMRVAFPLLVGGAFVAASAFAFVRGGLHVGRKLKPALIGVGTAVVLLGSVGVATAAWSSANSTSDSEFVGVGNVSVSPDGKWVAISKKGNGGARVWLVDVETGGLRLAVDGYSELPTADPWTVESNLPVVVSTFSMLHDDRCRELLSIEPSMRGVVERSTVGPDDVLHAFPRRQSVSWGEAKMKRAAGKDRYVYEIRSWIGGGVRTIEAGRVELGRKPGVVYALSDTTLSRLDVSKDASNAIASGVTWFSESRDGRRLSAFGDGGSRVIDATTGETLLSANGPGPLWWVESPVGRYVWSDRSLFDVEARRAVDLPPIDSNGSRYIAAVLKDGRFVTVTTDGINLHSAEGPVVRRLYPQQTERSAR